MTQFHIKIPFHISLLLYYNLQQKCCDTSPWVNTYGFPLLLLFNVGAAIPDNNIVTLAECQLYHFSFPPPLFNVCKKVLLLYELQNIPATQAVKKNCSPRKIIVYSATLVHKTKTGLTSHTIKKCISK